MNPTLDTTRSVALRSIEIMADGGRPDFDEVVAPGAVNHEAHVEPPACRGAGRRDSTPPRYGCAQPSPTWTTGWSMP